MARDVRRDYGWQVKPACPESTSGAWDLSSSKKPVAIGLSALSPKSRQPAFYPDRTDLCNWIVPRVAMVCQAVQSSGRRCATGEAARVIGCSAGRMQGPRVAMKS